MSHTLSMWVGGGLIAVMQLAVGGRVQGSTDLQLTLQPLAQPVVSIHHASLLESGTPVPIGEPHSIQQGDVLGFRLSLQNSGEGPSEAVAANLNPNQSTFSVWVAGPTGNEWKAPALADPRRRSVPQKARPLVAGEQVSLDMFIIRGTPEDEKETYVFPSPGVYRVWVEYELMDAFQRAEARRGGAPASKAIRSNEIVIHVGPPPEDWLEVQNTNIFYSIQYNTWPVQRAVDAGRSLEAVDPQYFIDRTVNPAIGDWVRRKRDQTTVAEPKPRGTATPK